MRRCHPFLDLPHPVAIAHRGGALEAEENTFAAFDHAVALGYRHVELDVHATHDGVVVVHHDPTLERMTGDSRAIATLDWATVRGLRTHGGQEVPRLSDLMDRHPDLHLTIEAKSDQVIAPLAGLLKRRGALEKVCVGAFRARRTARLRHHLGPDLCWSPAHLGVAFLWLRGWGLPLWRQPGFGVVQVPLRFRGLPVVTPRFVRAAHAAGVKVQVWTVSERPMIEQLLDMGVDGIMTDRPGLLRSILQERGQWPGR